MSNAEYTSHMIDLVLSLFPEVIRDSLVDDVDFKNRIGMQTFSRLTLKGIGASFDSKTFFDVVREALADSKIKQKVLDEQGSVWELSISANDGREFTLLELEDKKVRLPYFWPLSPSKSIRMSALSREAKLINLHGSALRYWHELMSSAPLEIEAYNDYREDVALTPLGFSECLSESIESGRCTLSDLVPLDVRYYERLVGCPLFKDDLSTYVAGGAKAHSDQLMHWCHTRGLELSLLSSCHSALISSIDLSDLSIEDVVSAFKSIELRGGVFSKLGAIELGLTCLDKHPELESILEVLVDEVLEDNPDDASGRFSFLSGLIVLVIGELARTKIFFNRPPYWVRLAAIAHASHIERVYVTAQAVPDEFASWVYGLRGSFFFLQSLIDMRLEPRWQPDFISPNQLKSEFLGQIANVATINKDKVSSLRLRRLLIDEDSGGKQKLLTFPHSFLPGPLEGGHASNLEMPRELLRDLEAQLAADGVSPDSFSSLVNCSLLFNITSDHARLAATALRKVKYQLQQTVTNPKVFSLISGLATVAAVTRSKELADEVRILSRVTRRQRGTDISLEDEMRIAMIAAASIKDIAGWAKFAGEWLTEIAFETKIREESIRLLAHVRLLIKLRPELAVTCAKAEAALSASVED